MFGQPGMQGFQPPDGAANPISQGRAAEVDALAGEDLALPVKGEMVGVFGHQHMGEQGRGGAALGDWPVRGGHLMYICFLALSAIHPELSRR
jgi:hypothetical protein